MHTTSRRQLILLADGALLVDTPGMREFGMLGTSVGLKNSFADVEDFAGDCRFADCTHGQEPGCALRVALESGELGEARYRSWQKLRKEAGFHDRSWQKKRKKERAFGRHLKAVKKQWNRER